MNLLDKYGLVREGGLLTMYIPATGRAFVFRVKGRANKGGEVLNYGPLPTTTSDTLSTYDGGSVSPSVDGTLPARAYTDSIKFSYENTSLYDTSDIWHVPEDYRDRLFHVITHVTPEFLRVGVEVPSGITQTYFQRTKMAIGVTGDWGFSRGKFEMLHIPKLGVGYVFGNDTNLEVYTHVTFHYAEYMIEMPTDPEAIFNVLTGGIPSHWVTMPVAFYDATIKSALISTYGFEGFPVMPKWSKDQAIEVYNALVSAIPTEVRG